MERYYLTQLPDNTWQITKQDNSSGEWVDMETQGIYPTWQEVQEQPISPLCYDPQPDWPEQLGGENG